MATFRPPLWKSLPANVMLLARDVPIVLGGMVLFYGLLSLARAWAAPVNTQLTISLDPRALPVYAAFSVARMTAAYIVSLVVALGYSYAAA
ncbi:MAG TPA: hypothetical protein VLV86_09495, partial [Vicinamibacterales bacterium]|nr:hypothetical protein [Vicinamibacterales bacterium]